MPHIYPYQITDRLTAFWLNHDLALNPQATPPSSSHGGAHMFKQWIDTSVYPAILRMCVSNPAASPGYIPSQWATMAAIHWGDPVPYITWGPEGGYLPLTGGTVTGTVSISLDLGVGRNFYVNGSAVIVGNISSSNLITANDVHTNYLSVNVDQLISRNLVVYGTINCQSHVGIVGTYYGAGLSITGEGYISGGLTIGQNIAIGNQINCFNIYTSYETIYGNLAVGNNITTSSLNAVDIGASNNISVGDFLAASRITAYSNISCSYDINAGRTVFAAGMQCGNIIVNSPADSAINVPAGGISAVHGLFGNRVSIGGGDTYALWVPFGSATVRVLRFSGPSGYDDQQMYIYSGPGAKIINYSNGCYWAWNDTTGDLTYVTQGYEWFQLQNGSTYVVNKVGPFQAWNYLYLSDRRSKTNIVPSEYGLDAVLALNPVKFNRPRKSVEEDYPPAEIGFVAQEVAEIIPEAVQPANVEFPDGTGGADSDAPALSLTIMPILGAMVEAFKQISARLVALEGGQ